jgi:hypothetical protein
MGWRAWGKSDRGRSRNEQPMSVTVPSSGRRPAYDPQEVRPVRFGWTKLREIGNSPAVKLTIAIPLVGYLIIFNESLLHYLDLSRELFGQPHTSGASAAHVSWRLLALYFGLCFIAVGAALYGWYCPDEIKSYRLPSDYINVLSNIGSIGITRIEAELEDGGAVARQQLHDWREVQSHRPTPQNDEQFMSRLAEANKGVLELHFDCLNRSHPYIRLATSICYAVGFVALFIPSVDVFVRVVCLMIRTIS